MRARPVPSSSSASKEPCDQTRCTEDTGRSSNPPIRRIGLRATLLAAAAGVAVAGGSLADAGTTPRAKLLSARTAVVSSPWRATVEVRGATRRPPVLRATLDATRRAAAMRRAGTNRWTASLTFPTAGSWRLSALVGTRSIALGVVAVRAASIEIRTAFKLALEPGGTLLVADREANRIARIDPRTGVASPVVERLRLPFAVTASADGVVYAIADERLHRIEGGRSTELASFAEEGPTDVAVASGSVYLARYGDHIDEFVDGRARPVARGFDRPHGVTAGPGGSLLVADTYAGAVRRIAPDGRVTTLATGLSSPNDVAVDLDGTLLVAEHGSGEVSRIAASGAVTVVTARLAGPTGVVVAPDGAIYVSDLDGAVDVGRVNRTTGAVISVLR